MEVRIRKLLERFEKVEELLGSSEILADREQYRALTQEHYYLSQVKEKWERCSKLQKQLEENQALVKAEKDPEFVAVIRDDIAQLEAAYQSEHLKLETLLVPPDPRDSRNIIVEFRAGTGGDEAAIFVGDCVRMYRAYADHKGWRYETPQLRSFRTRRFQRICDVLFRTERVPLDAIRSRHAPGPTGA